MRKQTLSASIAVLLMMQISMPAEAAQGDDCNLNSEGYCIFTGTPHHSGLQPGTIHVVDRQGNFLFLVNQSAATNSAGEILQAGGRPAFDGDELIEYSQDNLSDDERAFHKVMAVMYPIRNALMYDIADLTQNQWDMLVTELEGRDIKEATYTGGPTPKDNYYGRQGIFDLARNPDGKDITNEVMKFLEEAGIYLLCHVTSDEFNQLLHNNHPEGHDPCSDAEISTKIPFDLDGDGIEDSLDSCFGYDDSVDVNDNGIADGCDALKDSDGDGILDEGDDCPTEKGDSIRPTFGCPDSDGDDVSDACEIEAGSDPNATGFTGVIVTSTTTGNASCQSMELFYAFDHDGDGIPSGVELACQFDWQDPLSVPQSSAGSNHSICIDYFSTDENTDTDGDGYNDSNDDFELDPTQWSDKDGDGHGDNLSGNMPDQFPNDATQWSDLDGDGFGDNASGNNSDAFPKDGTQWTDIDQDGFGDNQNGSFPDAFPKDPTQHLDSDGDGCGDNLSGNYPDLWPHDPDNCTGSPDALTHDKLNQSSTKLGDKATDSPDKSSQSLQSNSQTNGALEIPSYSILILGIVVILLGGALMATFRSKKGHSKSRSGTMSNFDMSQEVSQGMSDTYGEFPQEYISQNAPSPILQGQMNSDGYEYLEWPSDSGQWYYRDPSTGQWIMWH